MGDSSSATQCDAALSKMAANDEKAATREDREGTDAAPAAAAHACSPPKPVVLGSSSTPTSREPDAEVDSLVKGMAALDPFAENPKLRAFSKKLAEARKVIVMVGAGASVSAGIPDFRTPGTGLYSQLAKYKLPFPEAVFEIEYFKKNPRAFILLASDLWPGGKYQPTPAHHFMKLLHDKGKLLRCYTQNIDSLERMADVPAEKIVAAHGNFDSATCVFTGKKVPIDEVKQAYLANDLDALNKKHGTKLVKPDIVFFGESLPETFHKLVPGDFAQCDLLIVLGTSLKVHPFAGLICHTEHGVPRLLINRERVGEFRGGGFDFASQDSADALYLGDCDDGVRLLANSLGWSLPRVAKATHVKQVDFSSGM